jgi:hypothetical protein
VRREITQRELRNDSGEIMRALDQGDWTAGTPDADLPPWAWHELERRLGKTRGLNPHNNGL